MKVVIFGATGMIGGGALTECLEDPDVSSVLCIGRTPSGRQHPKLRDLVVPDLFDLAAHRDEIGPFDACLYCLGVSSAGMSAERYRTITFDLTVVVADVLEGLNPHCRFCFISGQGSGSGRAMWAQVKGEAEEAVLARTFDGFLFRPGFIQPVKGASSRTALYRVIYLVLSPVTPLLRKLMPRAVTTTEILGRAMIRTAAEGFPRPVLETGDIAAQGGGRA